MLDRAIAALKADEATALGVWEMVSGFAGFGFPKAHGAAFGLLAYQSTWLRVHYGPEFLCSLLNEQPMGFYPPDALAHEAQRRGIEQLRSEIEQDAGIAALQFEFDFGQDFLTRTGLDRPFVERDFN